MKLYEIDNSIRGLWDRVIEQDGELTPEDMQELENLEVAKDEKIKGIGLFHREIVSDIAKVSQEIDRLKKIEKRLQAKADWFENYLSSFMIGNNMKEFKSLEVNITFRNSKSLQIVDGTKLAKKWLKVETKPDRQAIKDFISAGGKVKGCSIVENTNIQIK